MDIEKIKTRFRCTQCGDCCRWPGSVLLVEEDYPRLAAALGLSVDAFIDRYTQLSPNRRQLALIDGEGDDCLFLKDNGCSLYEARPEQCRTFPYAWRVESGCPALDALREETGK